MLSGCNGVSPWAGTASGSAHYLVETALGGYSSRLVSDWHPPDGYDPVTVSCIVPDYPNVWTDGSLILDKVAGISSSGAGFFADHSATFFGCSYLGAGLIVFDPLVISLPVEVSALFLVLISVFKELRCGCYLGFAVFWCCALGC